MKKYLAICIICLVAISCSDDKISNNTDDSNLYFKLKEGQVLYYDVLEHIDSVKEYHSERIHYVRKPAIINGRNCFEYYIESEPDKGYISYVITEGNAYYVYYENYTPIYSKYFPELKEIFAKLVSFDEDKWTQLDLKKDTVNEEGENITYEFKMYGEKIEDLMIEYKGEQHEAIKTSFLTYSTAYNTQTREVRIAAHTSGYESTVLKGIGIYENRRMQNGVVSNLYHRLIDHK